MIQEPVYNYNNVRMLCADVDLSLNQTLYSVSENDGFVEICADLLGELQRQVHAEILLVPTSASG